MNVFFAAFSEPRGKPVLRCGPTEPLEGAEFPSPAWRHCVTGVSNLETYCICTSARRDFTDSLLLIFGQL